MSSSCSKPLQCQWEMASVTRSRRGLPDNALPERMEKSMQNTQRDAIVYAQMLQTCGDRKAFSEGKRVHMQIERYVSEPPTFLKNQLISMYGKCGSLEYALGVFNGMCEKNVVTWTAIITAYSHNGQSKEALGLFRRMLCEGVMPNKVTFVTVLNACNSPGALPEGKLIHSHVIESGLEEDASVGTSLTNMYGKCGSLEEARRMLDKMRKPDVVPWSAVITAYTEHGHPKEALQLFWKMQLEGVMPNKITLVTILNACDGPAALPDGRLIHSHIVEKGFESNVIVGSALMKMYAKCGCLLDVRRAFQKLRRPNVVSWTTMIAACVQHGQCTEALQLFREMEMQHVLPDKITFVTIVNACASLAELTLGKLINAGIDDSIQLDVFLGNALVDMYAKCGSVEDAARVFNKMTQKDISSWNAMSTAYAFHGDSGMVSHLFHRMQQEGIEPDTISFVAILSACNHAGILEDGCKYFALSIDYGITPAAQHFGCLIDLLGRAGYLEEAESMLNKMPSQPDVMAWMMLLDACRTQRDLERGKRAAERVLELDPQNDAAYVVLAEVMKGRRTEGLTLIETYIQNGYLQDQERVKPNGRL